MRRGLTDKQFKQLHTLKELSYITGDLFSYNKIVINHKVARSEIEKIEEAVYYATHPKSILEIQEIELLLQHDIIKITNKYRCPMCGSHRKQLYETTMKSIVCKDCIQYHRGKARYIIIKEK